MPMCFWQRERSVPKAIKLKDKTDCKLDPYRPRHILLYQSVVVTGRDKKDLCLHCKRERTGYTL
jgi:hypothetical protein